MIRKILNNTSVYFLWLAFLVILAHSTVPHDHHLNDTLTNKPNNCHNSDGKTKSNSGFPLHCHAFNDYTSEDIIKYLIINDIQFYNISTNIFSEPFDLKVCFIAVFHDQKILLENPFLESNDLRAPPSI